MTKLINFSVFTSLDINLFGGVVVPSSFCEKEKQDTSATKYYNKSRTQRMTLQTIREVSFLPSQTAVFQHRFHNLLRSMK